MANYNFKNHVKGDTFNGATFTVTINGTPADLTSAHILMNLRLTADSTTAALTLTEGSGITISATPTDGKFTINSQIIDIPAEKYLYDIQITFANATVKTYIEGYWIIEQDVSHV